MYSVQRGAYPEKYVAQEKRKNNSKIKHNPEYPITCNGLLWIGGYLKHVLVRHPIILPKCHVTMFMVSFYNTKVQHQGQHFIEAIVRAAGQRDVAGKRLTCSVIHHSNTCRELRRKLEFQKMDDLPSE